MNDARSLDEDAPPQDDDGRSESALERADRNFNELLQELRVAQTGVQILFAFLLTAAFSQRFATFDQARDYFDTAYAVTVWCALISTGFLVAPVGFHRVLFRRQMKKEVVNAANALAMAGLFFLALAMGGSILLILDVAISRQAGIVGGAIAAVWLLLWWFFVPYLRLRADQRESTNRS
jgi:hypothetical protein